MRSVNRRRRVGRGLERGHDGSVSGGLLSAGRRGKMRRPPKVALLFSCLVFLIAAAAWLDVPSRIARQRALHAVARFDHEAAELWLLRARRWAWRGAEAELLAARIYRRQGRVEDMHRVLRSALHQGADPALVSLERAMAMAQSGHLQLVESELMAALQAGLGDAAEISDAYSNGLTVMSRFAHALEVLQAWRDDYPGDPRPDYRLGRLYEHQQLWEEAETHYRRSLAVRDTHYPARYRLGRVLLYGRRVAEARQEFEQCLTMRNPLAAKVQLAGCLRALGDSDEAAEILNQVVAHDYEAVLASYAAMGESPEHYEAAAMLGDIQSESGNDADAVPWLRLAVEKNPRDLSARYSLAVALRQLGRTAQAEAHFEAVRTAREALQRANPLRERISQSPEDHDARLELGQLLLEHESQRMGVFWLRSVLATDPKNRRAHELLAQHFKKMSQRAPRYADLATYHQQQAAEGPP